MTNVQTPRDGLVDPGASSCCDLGISAVIAPDNEALALPFFDTAGDAARHAAAIVVVFEFFGLRVRWVAVVAEQCYRYRAAACIKHPHSMTNCDAMDVLAAALHGFQGVSRAGIALNWADTYVQFSSTASVTTPDAAARRLVAAVLCPRNAIVTEIATRLLELRPFSREELLVALDECHDFDDERDLFSALVDAANIDMPCEWPMHMSTGGVYPACGDPFGDRFNDK